jgi:hypothetical protein
VTDCPNAQRQSREKAEGRGRKGNKTKQTERIGKSFKVAEGQRRLKDLEEGGKGLAMVEEIRRRRMNEFDPTTRSGKVA